ncbi:response regulator transcription factor [Tardiphaga sp. 1201_B9_N1_1]|uniref:Response regulator transcription factor n=1 Tax=Tardiphaga robiniae TaxID=943830 RepID=A0A7G6U960_9BRAD|nr:MULTISPECIES: response regulator transcription factor [Tardiphaga]QND75542.1 response regulator transcription factor [Tardiphaga robiniae]UFS78585.1 response regulator transcription factor [Tardiphaga sp. 37S4]WNV12046.1 response regulator transcription factor [Tardiphaga sp. 709]WPO44640.1 response regulator transcription factor [Tardiphaga sp. 42S5]
MRVLLIEDDAMFGKALVRGLSENGMSVDWARNGRDGFAAMDRSEYAVALIDIGLPKMSGLDVLKAKRKAGMTTPALIITARDGVSDMVAGLDLGADDYIVKPFELPVLLARIRAVTRRANGRVVSLMTSAEITLDPSTQVATFRDIKHLLSVREFAVLQALMERPGQILSRSQIESRIYGWGEEVQSNAVDVLIHGLRKKFDKDIVRNVRGAGWMVTKEGA